MALKLLTPQGGVGGEPTLRLRREFRAIQRLEHPGVVRVLELESGAPAYIALEYVDGQNLFEALGLAPPQRPDPATTERLLDLAEQVLATLDYVHSRNVLRTAA